MTVSITRDQLHLTDLMEVDSGERIAAVTPGEVLRAEFMEPLGLSAQVLAREMQVPVNRVSKILRGERSITARTALALAARFETSPEFWMHLQTAHDLERARAGLPDRPAQRAA